MTFQLDCGGAVEDAETVLQGQRPQLSYEEFASKGHQESSELAPSAPGSSSAPTELLQVLPVPSASS